MPAQIKEHNNPPVEHESPFFEQELFVDESEPELEMHLTALEAESEFKHAFEESPGMDIVELEEVEEVEPETEEFLGRILDRVITPRPSAASDPTVAVPPFNRNKRLLLPVKLLEASKNADAIVWNKKRHPKISGIDPNVIRTDLSRYVDLKVVEDAITRFNQANTSAAIAKGTPPIDAVFVEAVHQFQAKCFLETGQIDGLAGESTLDSLGLVNRSGLNRANQQNSGAVQRLRKVDVPGLTGNEFTADNWFNSMVNPTFLGWRFTTGGEVRGVHLFFMRRLRIAEKALIAQPRYRDMTPVELGRALGFDEKSEEHKGGRPTSTAAGMHTYGLAVDIKYNQNPWVIGDNFITTLKRAARLISGVQITHTSAQQFFHSLGSARNLTTERIFEILSQRDRDFRRYLGLFNNTDEIQDILEQRRVDGTSGIFTSAEERADQALQRWKRLIRQDRVNMKANKRPFYHRDPENGFLNLNKDLVVALRDKACLAWGAVDLGPGDHGSGDIMHFDARVGGLGHQLAVAGRNFRVISGHPCLPDTVVSRELVEEKDEDAPPDESISLEHEQFVAEEEDWIEQEEEGYSHPPEDDAREVEEQLEALDNLLPSLDRNRFDFERGELDEKTLTEISWSEMEDAKSLSEEEFDEEAYAEEHRSTFDEETLKEVQNDDMNRKLEAHELNPELVDLAERTMARETPLFEQQLPRRWTTCFSAGDIAKVQRVYEENALAASHNSVDRASCIVMLNVAIGQLLPLRLKPHPARSRSSRRVQMASLTTATIERAMHQLHQRGFNGPKTVINFYDRRNHTAGTLKPERLKTSVQNRVLARSTTGGCWFAFALSVMDGYHSVLLLVDRTGADAKIYWLDQFSGGVNDDVTNSLDERTTTKTRAWWQAVMDDKGKGYKTTIRLWQLRKPRERS